MYPIIFLSGLLMLIVSRPKTLMGADNILKFCKGATRTIIREEDAKEILFVKSSDKNSQCNARLMSTIFSLTTIAENSQTGFEWNYAENLHDGRGITFGIIGFTSGTYDGTSVIEEISQVNPTHKLASYLKAFQAIDELPHGDQGKTDNIKGLQHFIADFEKYGDDFLVKKIQYELLLDEYWEPAVKLAKEIGVQNPLTLGQIYDACVNHGYDGEIDAKGLIQLVQETSLEMNGCPKQGIDENQWLSKFLDIREAYLSADPLWEQSLDRIRMYRKLLKQKNIMLNLPIQVKCYGNRFVIKGNENLIVP